MITNDELFLLNKLIHEKQVYESRDDLLKFTYKTMPEFKASEFHNIYYHLLDLFSKGEIKRLMITMPPQHGKSEGSTRRLPAFIFGKNPNTKIAVASYNTTFARKFNRDIQRIIDTKEYHEIFPSTYLSASNVVTVSTNFLRNSEEFEIVDHKGSLKAIGRGGALTGNSVDIMIMDDLYKDYAEGNSPVIRDSVWDWYTTVVKTRLHNDSQELIVFTRWNEDDLIGRLERKENVVTINSLNDLEGIKPNDWVKINFEAIQTQEPTKIDGRIKGAPLWDVKHNLEKLENTRALDPENFNCLYQGNPKSKEGLLYGEFKTYNQLPTLKIRKAIVDTADKGTDYLCAITYGEPLDENDDNIYVLDVLYTQQPMEITEGLTAEFLIKSNVNSVDIESNNGGRSFARVVDDKTPVNIIINWYHQSDNKESRIFSNSATVTKRVVFPERWSVDYSEFYDHVSNFKKLFKANKYDDCADTLTSIIEKTGNNIFVV
jgi:predicted phage terminase large subunit-like protein